MVPIDFQPIRGAEMVCQSGPGYKVEVTNLFFDITHKESANHQA
jgi:hypothetical protein